MASIQLPNTDARLTYLALQYHLSRPGSELDAESGRPGGLREVATALEPQLEQAVATIDLNRDQLQRLDAAIGGSINELKATQIMNAGGPSMVPQFKEALHRLFPNVAADPEEALPLAGHMLQLRRRVAQAAASEAEASTPESASPWWRFWKR